MILFRDFPDLTDSGRSQITKLETEGIYAEEARLVKAKANAAESEPPEKVTSTLPESMWEPIRMVAA
jgi:hypothetical protein